jgi:hypothetical protein
MPSLVYVPQHAFILVLLHASGQAAVVATLLLHSIPCPTVSRADTCACMVSVQVLIYVYTYIGTAVHAVQAGCSCSHALTHVPTVGSVHALMPAAIHDGQDDERRCPWHHIARMTYCVICTIRDIVHLGML